MARKRYWDEDALKVLREIDVHLHDGLDVPLQRLTGGVVIEVSVAVAIKMSRTAIASI